MRPSRSIQRVVCDAINGNTKSILLDDLKRDKRRSCGICD